MNASPKSRLPAWARPKDMLDLTRLAVPVAISRASFMLMSLTDAVLLGRYAPGELPYVQNGWLPIGVLFGFGMGLMIGVQVLTAELNGAGKANETGRIFRRGMVETLLAAPMDHATRLQGAKVWHLALLEYWLQRHVDGAGS